MKIIKRTFALVALLLIGFGLTSCFGGPAPEPQKDSVSIISPAGTPALGIAKYATEFTKNEKNTFEIVPGPDPLKVAFMKGTHDIIIAPVNLGSVMYHKNANYRLFKTSVWGNLFLASKTSKIDIKEFSDLEGKTVVSFGKGATPEIVFNALNKYYNVNVNVVYVNDVAEANKMLMADKAEIVLTAQPALTKLQDKMPISTIDLQDEWSKVFNQESYPQAGIFVRKDVVNDSYVQDVLNGLADSVKDTVKNPEAAAEAAVSLHASFASLGKDTLVKAIPHSHFNILGDDKAAVLFYLQKMIDLGFAAQVGGSLPADEFFIPGDGLITGKTSVKIVSPAGTPALGIATYAEELSKNSENSLEIVAGPDPLKAAFIKGTHDIIIAPVNLGSIMYQKNGNYLLYKTSVWGNLFLASKGTLNSIFNLEGKTVVSFGKGSTPEIVLSALLNHYHVSCNIEYVADVATANKMLASGKAEVVLTAEPALSKLREKLQLNVVDLQDEWKKLTGSESYPQAGIFVRKDLVKDRYVNEVLQGLSNAVVEANENPEACAKAAASLHPSFASLGVETLVRAIPNSHLRIAEQEKDAVLFYLQKMIDLGFAAQVGGALPDEGFFLSK